VRVGAEEHILDAARRAGLTLPSACEIGWDLACACRVLEGDWEPTRLVVLEFEDLDAVKRWYDSPEYQAAKKLREGAANLRMVAVQGI